MKQISKSANQQISKSANQQISKSANQQKSKKLKAILLFCFVNIAAFSFAQTSNGKTAQIDLRKYPKGMYFLTITGSKKIITQKLIYE